MLIEASGEESEWVTVKEVKPLASSVSVDERMMENIERSVQMEGMDWLDE